MTTYPLDMTHAEYVALDRYVRNGWIEMPRKADGQRDYEALNRDLPKAAKALSMVHRMVTDDVRRAHGCETDAELVSLLAQGNELTVGPAVIRITREKKGRKK